MTRTTLQPRRLAEYATITRTVEEAAEALTAGCLPCELAAMAAADADAAQVQGSDVTWSGPIGIEGELTGDGRMIDANALRWATLPMPLRIVMEDQSMGHAGAVVAGRILTLERRGDEIWGTGDIDMASENGREAARQIDAGLKQGISMDLDEVSFEVRVAKELLEEFPITEEEAVEERQEELDSPTDDEGRVTVLEINADDEVMVTTDARVRAATIVDIPAFERARITLDSPLADRTAGGEEGGEGEEPQVAASATVTPLAAAPSLAASGYPVAPPAAWFDNPGLPEPTRVTITPEGRIYGHVAEWGTCHTGYPGQCVTPPPSPSGYAYYRTGTVLTAEGTEVPVGRITMDTLHAGRNLSAADTMAHYENTGRAVADVAAGEDAHGIWIAGALRPGVTPEQVRSLRASPLSGDWREIRGQLELLAALAVNVPGFPIPRPQGLVASGRMVSLVAAGMMPPGLVRLPGTPGSLSEEDLTYLRRLADRERSEQQARDDRAAEMARRIRADALAAEVFGRTLTPTH